MLQHNNVILLFDCFQVLLQVKKHFFHDSYFLFINLLGLSRIIMNLCKHSVVGPTYGCRATKTLMLYWTSLYWTNNSFCFKHGAYNQLLFLPMTFIMGNHYQLPGKLKRLTTRQFSWSFVFVPRVLWRVHKYIPIKDIFSCFGCTIVHIWGFNTLKQKLRT